MNVETASPSPTDQMLAWISARGRASRPTIERAARAIVERFETRPAGEHTSFHHRYVGPLRRLGHVESVSGGLVVVPTTLCWSPDQGRGLILGARDEMLRGELFDRFGSQFQVSHPGPPWPATWRVVGDIENLRATMAELGVEFIQEAGTRLLASLPMLEEAIASWPDDGRPPAALNWEELTMSPERSRWRASPESRWPRDGLLRSRDDYRGGWMIMRDDLGRRLNSPEKRAVAWWAELARQLRPRLDYHRETGRLALPASLLPPPSMIERPLIWASSRTPRRDGRMRRSYEPIDPARAEQVARVLGLGGDFAS